MYGNNYMNGYMPYYMPNNGAVPDMLNQQKMQYQNMPMQSPQMPMNNQPMPNTTPAPAPMPKMSGDMIWVLGQVEAESYPVAPNNTVILWDKNSPTIYIKSVDNNRTPSFRILDFTERTGNAPENGAGAKASASNINTQSEELKAVQSKLDGIESILDTKYEDLKAKIDGLTAKINTSTPTSRSTSK